MNLDSLLSSRDVGSVESRLMKVMEGEGQRQKLKNLAVEEGVEFYLEVKSRVEECMAICGSMFEIMEEGGEYLSRDLTLRCHEDMMKKFRALLDETLPVWEVGSKMMKKMSEKEGMTVLFSVKERPCGGKKGVFGGKEGVFGGKEGLRCGKEGPCGGKEGLRCGKEGVFGGKEGLRCGKEGLRCGNYLPSEKYLVGLAIRRILLLVLRSEMKMVEELRNRMMGFGDLSEILSMSVDHEREQVSYLVCQLLNLF